MTRRQLVEEVCCWQKRPRNQENQRLAHLAPGRSRVGLRNAGGDQEERQERLKLASVEMT